MSRVGRFGWWSAFIALGIGYALLAHYTNTTAGTETLGTVVALAPIMLAALSMAWHSVHRKRMLLLFAVACAALLLAWSLMERHFSRIYWIEHAGTQMILCVAFGRTLRPGREPMCTYFARMVHGTLTPELEQYTRQITAAWVWFFGSMAAISTVLFYAASLTAWSVFANFFTAPLIAAMFIIEYAVRRCRLPQMEHAHILDAVKAFWKAPAR